jgi:hypothetical protein
MTDTISKLGFLAGATRFRRIGETHTKNNESEFDSMI